MKQFLTVLVSMTGVVLCHTAASPQEAEGCFMVNSSGNVVNLTNLCTATFREALKNPIVFQAKIESHRGGTPVVEVTFNGKQKFEMLLDTGATQTTITPLMASTLGVVPVGKEKVYVASGEVVEFPFGRVTSIEVGGAVINDAMVSIGAVPLLGQNFFGGYNITIKRDVVEFHPRN